MDFRDLPKQYHEWRLPLYRMDSLLQSFVDPESVHSPRGTRHGPGHDHYDPYVTTGPVGIGMEIP